MKSLKVIRLVNVLETAYELLRRLEGTHFTIQQVKFSQLAFNFKLFLRHRSQLFSTPSSSGSLFSDYATGDGFSKQI